MSKPNAATAATAATVAPPVKHIFISGGEFEKSHVQLLTAKHCYLSKITEMTFETTQPLKE